MRITNKRLILRIFFACALVINIYGQGFFDCQDTPYLSDSKPHFLRSKYHLFQSFGDVSLRSTNFFQKRYNGIVAWSENRLFFPHLSEILKIPLPDPYVTFIVKWLKDIDWEKRIDYGIGLEWRPFKYTTFSESILKWFHYIRFYYLFLRTKYLLYKEGWYWRPMEDVRIGIELYRECNLYNEKDFWGEFWSDYSWRKTNFYSKDYRGWLFAFVPKIGIKVFPTSEYSIMPYLIGDIAVTNKKEFWQNHIALGIGIRIMPFRWQGDGKIFIKGIRFYVEGLDIIKYLQNKAPVDTPHYDFKMGINYTIYRW